MAGFNGASHWKKPWLAWLPFVYAGLPFINLIWRDFASHVDARVVAAAAANGLVRGTAVAILEETTFRGLVLAILLNRFHDTRAQIRKAVLISGVLFGLWHLPVQPHWETNVAQWVYAALAGVGFAAVLLRTRSIWLGIAAHALLIVSNFIVAAVTVDVPPSLTQARWGAIVSVAMMLPWLFYGLYDSRCDAARRSLFSGR
jgi:membrane protease YdiL (CAAX protease family)